MKETHCVATIISRSMLYSPWKHEKTKAHTFVGCKLKFMYSKQLVTPMSNPIGTGYYIFLVIMLVFSHISATISRIERMKCA